MLSSCGDTTRYFVFLAIGKLVIYIVQTAGILEPVWKSLRILEERARGRFAFWPADHFISEEFRECGWCIGCYIFPILCAYYRINVFDFFSNGIISYILTGFVSSFIIHLVSGGYHYYFGEGS